MVDTCDRGLHKNDFIMAAKSDELFEPVKLAHLNKDWKLPYAAPYQPRARFVWSSIETATVISEQMHKR